MAEASVGEPQASGVHRIRDFRLLWMANVAQEVGRQVSLLALSVTAIVVLDATAWQVGVITALGNSAYLLVGLPAGVWIDRWPKRPVMVTVELVRVVAALSVPVAFLGDWLTILQLMVVAGVVSFSMVFSDTAQTAFVPRIVGPQHVSEATARLQSTDTTMQVVGPGFAALLLTRVAAPYLYWVSVASAVFAALMLRGVRTSEPASEGKSHQPFWPAIRSGVSFVFRHPALRVFMGINACLNTGAGAFATLATLVALQDFGVPPEQYAIAGSVGAVGGIMGATLGLRVKRWLGEIRTIVVCYCLLPGAALILPLGYLLPGPGVIYVAASDFVFGLVIVVSSISAAGLRAQVTPLDMMGRVSSASRFVTLGALPVGALLGGALGEWLPFAYAILVAPFLMVIAAMICLASPLRARRHLPEEWVPSPGD